MRCTSTTGTSTEANSKEATGLKARGREGFIQGPEGSCSLRVPAPSAFVESRPFRKPREEDGLGRIPSGAEAPIDLLIEMYGLKPVPSLTLGELNSEA
jgi:hypothetical protein